MWQFHTPCISRIVKCFNQCKNLFTAWPYINPAGTFIQKWKHSRKYRLHAIPIELSQSMTFQINCHQLWHLQSSCISWLIQCISQCKNLLRSFPYLDPAGTFLHTWMHSRKYAVHAIPIELHSIWHLKRIVTGWDIFTHHAFQDLYNASVIAKTYTDHAPISYQLAHSFTHECIHANMHYMQSQFNCHSLWHFK